MELRESSDTKSGPEWLPSLCFISQFHVSPLSWHALETSFPLSFHLIWACCHDHEFPYALFHFELLKEIEDHRNLCMSLQGVRMAKRHTGRQWYISRWYHIHVICPLMLWKAQIWKKTQLSGTSPMRYENAHPLWCNQTCGSPSPGASLGMSLSFSSLLKVRNSGTLLETSWFPSDAIPK